MVHYLKVSLRPELHRAVKAAAALRSMTLQQFVAAALEQAIVAMQLNESSLRPRAGNTDGD